MKPIHKMLLLVTLLALAGSAWAVKKETDTSDTSGNSGGVQAPRQTMSDKDKWACEVAMCLSNPQGPTAVAECKPPIDKMRRELAKGHSIPKCPFVGSSNNGGGGNTGGGGREEERPAQQIQ